MNRSEIRTPAFLAVALFGLSACAHVASSNRQAATPSSTVSSREGVGVMDKCQAKEALVVENKTPYAARVIATDGGPNAFAGGHQLLEVVPSGRVDTIPRMATSHQKIQFDLEQPAMPSGANAPVSGLRARCVPHA